MGNVITPELRLLKCNKCKFHRVQIKIKNIRLKVKNKRKKKHKATVLYKQSYLVLLFQNHGQEFQTQEFLYASMGTEGCLQETSLKAENGSRK